MFKTKLLILFLSSLFLLSCTSDKPKSNIKLSIAYIAGEYDGLLLKNQLSSHLKNLNMLDNYSVHQVEADIIHSSNVFITNIDNTSDREKIKSTINLKIYNKKNKCYSYSYSNEISQFYILASSDNFSSNKIAVQQIKFENTEYFVKTFINDVIKNNLECHDKK